MDVPRLSTLIGAPGKRLSAVTLVRSLAMSKNQGIMGAALIAEQRFPQDAVVVNLLKSAVAAGSLSDSDWAAPLWQYIGQELIEAARPSSIIGRLANARRVPFNCRSPRTTTSSSSAWVAPGASIPVSEMAFDALLLGVAKLGGLLIISQELAKSASPSAEATIRQDLIGSINSMADRAFCNPSFAAVVDEHPGSILSGVTPIASAGATAANIVTDLNAAIDALLAGGSKLQSPMWIMHPKTAVRLSLKRSTDGATAFPDARFNGGSLAGIPLISSTSVPLSVSGGSILILCDQAELCLATDDAVVIDTSTEASVQLSDTPAAGAYQQISLFSQDLCGIRAIRSINWCPVHSAAATAAYIDQVAY